MKRYVVMSESERGLWPIERSFKTEEEAETMAKRLRESSPTVQQPWGEWIPRAWAVYRLVRAGQS